MCSKTIKKAARSTRSALTKKNSLLNYNNSAAQRLRILEWLQKGKPLTTPQAREILDVMHPSGRIKELKDRDGHNIIKIMVHDETAQGNKHRFAQYSLLVAQPK